MTTSLFALALLGCSGSDVYYEEVLDSELAVTVATGSTMSIVGVQSSNCLGLKGNATANGTLVQMQGCSGSNFQKWTATRDSSGYYALKNVGSGLCLDVTGNSTAEGTNLQVWGCAGSDNQKWNLSDQGNQVFAIVSKSSGLAVDVYNYSTANGARVVQWSWLAGANQKFTLPGASFASGTSSSSGVNGFAATSVSGLSTTTGGGTATPTVVSSCSALKSALEDATARVVQVASGTTLDCRTSPVTIQACQIACGTSDTTAGKVYWRVPVGTQTCADLGGGTLVNRTTNAITVNVNSNKTLIGAGTGATLKGVSLNISGKSNIIVRNLTISEINPSLVEAGDGLTVNNSHHVWIDHNRFSMISDGYFDIKSSNAVTVSYNHIVGANSYVCGGKHHYISLVDASTVTYHHNFFDGTSGRNPKSTGATQVHLYNNYYKNVSYFCLSAATGVAALVESNYYENSRYPHWSEGGQIEAKGNQYVGTSADASQKRDNNADVFTPSYSYSLDSVSGIPASVVASAGPRQL